MDGRWGTRFKAMKKGAVDKIIKKLTRRAQIRKPVSLSWLRHTQCTFYADKDVNEAKMRQIFGWTSNSKMPSRYSHLTGRSGKKTVLSLRGIEKIEEKVESHIIQPKKCLRCREMNPFDADYCKKCATVLDQEEAQKMVEHEKKVDEILELFGEANVTFIKRLEDMRAFKEYIDELEDFQEWRAQYGCD